MSIRRTFAVDAQTGVTVGLFPDKPVARFDFSARTGVLMRTPAAGAPNGTSSQAGSAGGTGADAGAGRIAQPAPIVQPAPVAQPDETREQPSNLVQPNEASARPSIAPRPSKAGAAATPASTLGAEAERLDEARRASSSRAVYLVREFHRDYPSSPLAADAEIVAMKALLDLGEREMVRQRAVQFLARFPGDPHERRVRDWLDR